MKVLLIEDEEHKATDLEARLRMWGGAGIQLTFANGVRNAILSLDSEPFELIVLDMALPTFGKTAAATAAGGVDQSVGGIEVLRALQRKGITSQIIVVTQYPEIAINGRVIKLSKVRKFARDSYNQNVIGCVLYSFSAAEWAATFDELLGRVK